jgi:two-component system heavy metal sensor histidine kinase CusS
MFLKNAKEYIARSSSITVRLTLFYTVATTFLLVLTIASLYWVMTHSLYQSEHQLLSDEVDILQNIVEKKRYHISDLKQKIREIPPIIDSSVYDHYIRILNDKRQIITETNKMSRYLQGATFFSQLAQKEKTSEWWQSTDGTYYLLMQSPILLDKDGKNPWVIQVALDVSFQRDIIKKYRNKLVAGLFIGVFCALCLGYGIARRSLRRLNELTETTKAITVSSLHQRIDPTLWPNELRALGMSFNQMLGRIEDSFSRLTQFSADLAHELRTPINNLIMEAEVVLCKVSSMSEYKNTLESNLEEAKRISQIIENLLFLARAEQPNLTIEKNTLSLEKEIHIVIDFYQALIDEKNINVSCVGTGKIVANSNMVRRMLSNLLSNALKYSPLNCAINFEIKIFSNTLQLILRDMGCGISDEHLPKIFNRFYRIDSARSQAFGGTGLGLAIVKSIIDLHQGSIEVNSQVGIGTTFSINFPR